MFNEPISVYCSSLDPDFQAVSKVYFYTLYFQNFIPQNIFTHFNCL
jgi:hypothetical protein